MVSELSKVPVVQSQGSMFLGWGLGSAAGAHRTQSKDFEVIVRRLDFILFAIRHRW